MCGSNSHKKKHCPKAALEAEADEQGATNGADSADMAKAPTASAAGSGGAKAKHSADSLEDDFVPDSSLLGAADSEGSGADD